ncbi:MAG: leucine-rich repeat domain-containing protein [Bacteroidaceae bacterium]|nr:leucine-rich repeat domain-containing protein [Bacteroidaceae bacterium]
MVLPLVASAHDIEVKNADGVTIYYNYTNDGTELAVTSSPKNYKYQGNVVIPEEVTYGDRIHKVTSIGESAFYNCTGLTSVTIPNSVTSIDNGAFEDCI